MATMYSCKVKGKKHGPFNSNQLRKLASGGKISPDDLICKEGEERWVKASQIKALFSADESAANKPPSKPVAAAKKPASTKPKSQVPKKVTPVRPAANPQPQNDSIAPPTTPVPISGHIVAEQVPQVAPVPASDVLPDFMADTNSQQQQFHPPRPQHAQQPQFHPQQPQHAQQPQFQPQYEQPQQFQQPQQSVVVQNVIQNTVVHRGSQKSVAVAILLALFFGPLGMLYSTVPGALVMFLVNVILIIPTLGGILLITIPVGCIWAASAAGNS